MIDLDDHCRFLERDGGKTHATGSAQCRQECRERSYYHLHRQLNHSLFLHTRILIFASDSHGISRSLFLVPQTAVAVVGNVVKVV